MAAVKVKNLKNEVVGETKLAAFWGEDPNGALIHQAVVRALAGERAGTHATKTRQDVSGGGKKPFKQKGTGRARQGTSRAPQMRGGGTIFGPQPRDYSQGMNKKMSRKALASALASKKAGSALLVLDGMELADHKTKSLVAAMDSLGVTSALVVAEDVSDNLRRAAGNLSWLKVVTPDRVNAYDVLAFGSLVITKGALKALEGTVA